MKARKDKPSEPVISNSECRAGLRLVEEILDRIVDRGDVPEQTVVQAAEFRNYLEGLDGRLRLKAKDEALLRAAVLGNTLPTLRIFPWAVN